MGKGELLPLYHFGYFFPFHSLIKLSLSQPMGFLTLAFPAFSSLLLEEGNSDWVLGFWGQPTTLHKANPPLQRVHQQQRMPGQG